MPLDAEENWKDANVLTGEKLRQLIGAEIGELEPIAAEIDGQPAVDFAYTESPKIKVGFINSVSEPFCSTCNRLRITSEGQVRNCLFSTKEWDARKILREGGSDDDLKRLVFDCVGAKALGHGTNDMNFVRPEKAMYQIGG